MKLEILGMGCQKCTALEMATKEAITKIGGFHQVVKIEDINTIMAYGVIDTPALVVDGIVKSSGKLLTADQIVTLISK